MLTLIDLCDIRGLRFKGNFAALMRPSICAVVLILDFFVLLSCLFALWVKRSL
jgi:hypothetical protein